MNEETALTQVKDRDEKGRFLKGVSGNPSGMSKGIKHRATQIKEAFFQVFIDEFGDPDDPDSMKSLKEYARLHKTDFLKIVAGLTSKEIDRMNINIKAEATAFDDETKIPKPHMVIFSAVSEECYGCRDDKKELAQTEAFNTDPGDSA